MDVDDVDESGEIGRAHSAHPGSDLDGTIQVAHNTEPGQQSPPRHEHQTLLLPPLQPSLASKPTSTSRKRKSKQFDGTTSSATRGGINDLEPCEVNRSDLEWARINNREEADAAFIAQQLRRANLKQSTL